MDKNSYYFGWWSTAKEYNSYRLLKNIPGFKIPDKVSPIDYLNGLLDAHDLYIKLTKQNIKQIKSEYQV